MRRLEGRVTGKAAQENDHFSITLPSSAVEELDDMATEQGATRSAVIREMVLDGIKRKRLVQKIVEAVA